MSGTDERVTKVLEILIDHEARISALELIFQHTIGHLHR